MKRDEFEELFNLYLARYLARTNHSPAQFARKLKKHRSTISKWADGTNIPTIKNLYELARIFELTEEEIRVFFEKAGQGDVIKFAHPESQRSPSSPIASPNTTTNININTDGGAYVDGNISTGGDFTGRDKTTLQGIGTIPRSIPHQYPPPVPCFTGREEEIKRIVNDLYQRNKILVCGPSGIGKTALAIQTIHQLISDGKQSELFPDGVIFHDFSVEPQAENFFTKIALAFGEERIPTALASVQHALDRRKVLLVLNATENADDLQLILSVLEGCGVLITSRSREKIIDYKRHDLKPLPFENEESEAVRLLQIWGGARAADKEVALEICKTCGGLPLALRLAGSDIESGEINASAYLTWLKKEPMSVLNLVRRQIEHSLTQVTEESKQALAVVGLLAPDFFSCELVAAALNVTVEDASYILRDLVRFSLLERPDDRYRVTHTLIHTYARGRLSVAGVVIPQLGLYYLTFLQKQSELGSEGHSKLHAERTHLIAFVASCVKKEQWIIVHGLTQIIAKYLDLPPLSSDYKFVSKSGLLAAQALDDKERISFWLHQIGEANRNPGQEEQGIKYYQQSIAISREFDHRGMEALSLHGLGIIHIQQGKVEQGVQCLEQAIMIMREIGDKAGECLFLTHLGSACGVRGKRQQGIEFMEQALTIARQINHRRLEGLCLGGLGKALIAANKTEEGIEYCHQALTIVRMLSDQHTEAGILNSLVVVYLPSDAEKAIEYCQQGIAIARKLDDQWLRVIFESKLWLGYIHLGQIEQGLAYCEQALTSAHEIGDRFHEWLIYLNVSEFYKGMGYHEEATKMYQKAVELDPDNAISKYYYLCVDNAENIN